MESRSKWIHPQATNKTPTRSPTGTGPAGQRWADRQAAQDILLGPVLDILIDRAKPAAGERVIDVGCGSGATVDRVRAKGRAEQAMCSASTSRRRCWNGRDRVAPADLPVDFALADATVYPFDPAELRSSGLAVRRDVLCRSGAVLRQYAKALKPSGRLAFACWREPRENPWMMAPLQAVYKHVPKLPPQGPEDPGTVRVCLRGARPPHPGPGRFHRRSRWSRAISPLDVAIGRGLEAAVQAAFEIGPASRALEGHPPEIRAAAASSVREALAAFVQGETVPLPASIWIVTARPS